jgi:hypothetical protein
VVTDNELLQTLTQALPTSRPFITIPSGYGLRQMRARAEVGSRLVQASIWGDSISAQGQGSTNPRDTSYAGLLEGWFHTHWGDGGSGYLSHEYAVKTGTWTGEMGFAGGGARATATATLQWTNIYGTSIRIFHRNANVTGSFRWRVDGGSWTTVTPPTAFGQEPGDINATGLADIAHTVDIEWLSGTVVIHGLQATRTRGVVVNRLGQSGRAASHYAATVLEHIPAVTTTNGNTAITTASGGSFRPYMAGKYLSGTGIPADTTIASVTSATAATLSANANASGTNAMDLTLNAPSWSGVPGTTNEPFLANGLGRPDICIIPLGANDPASADYSGATYRDGASKIVSQYLSSNTQTYAPDTIFLIPHFANWFDTRSIKADIAAAVADMAEGVGAALVDVWGAAGRSFKKWNDAGFFADTVHPTDRGHRFWFDMTIQALVQ